MTHPWTPHRNCLERMEMNENKKNTWNNLVSVLLLAYAKSLSEIPKKYYVKSTGQEHHGTIYLQEGIGLTNGFGELIEWR